MKIFRLNAGLVIAIAGVLVCLGALVVTGGVFSLIPKIGLAISVIGICTIAILNPQRIRWSFSRKLPRYTANGFIFTIALLGILAAVNYLAYLKPLRWDITEDQQNSLSPDTKAILEKLDSPIYAQAFFTTTNPSGSAEQLLESFSYNTPNNNFTYEFFDPDANPLLAQQANVLKDGTIVLVMDDRSEQVTYATEQELISAILRLMNPSERNIYFLTGHGEYDPFGTDDLSYSFVQQALAVKNYNISTLNLLTSSAIPLDAKTVVIAGPQKPLTEGEIILIDNFIDEGGNLVVLLEPTFATDIAADNDLLADWLRSKCGIDPQNDVILDPNVSPPVIAIAEYYADHPITEKLSSTATVFPTSLSFLLFDANEEQEFTISQLVLTSDATWGETNEDQIISGEPVFNIGKDTMGPLLLAIVGENATTSSKIVVIGDSDFASNAYFQEYANGDLIINSIEWTTGENELLNLTPGIQTERILVPPDTIFLGLILLTTVFLIPGSFIVLGMWTLIKQRKTM